MINDFKILFDSNRDEAEQIIKKIVEDKIYEAIPTLIIMLEETNDNWIRNDIALALSDLKEQKAVEPIIKMIKSPKTEGNRGTLVYALEELDYSEHIEFIFTLLLNGNFEVSRNAYSLIEKFLDNHNSDIKLIKKQIPLIIKKINSLQYDIDLFISALELLSR